MDIIQIITHGSNLYQQEVTLRYRVLREPLGLNFTEAQLAAEHCDHHLGVLRDEKLIGVLILTPKPDGQVQMRQVAMAPEVQGTGVGRKLVEASEQLAIQQGFRKMILHARMSAAGFYRALGYLEEGEIFEEVGIPHIHMFKNLTSDSADMVS